MHLHAARLVPAPHFGEEEENPLDVDSTTVREGLHAEECKFGMGGFYLMVALGCGATQLTLGVGKVARLLSRLAACTVTERIRVYGLAVANKNGV